MSVLPDEPDPKPAVRAAKRFWSGLAERLDALVAFPVRHAVSEQDLRRVDDDIKRCRQLMLNKAQHRRNAKLGRLAMPQAVRAMKIG